MDLHDKEESTVVQKAADTVFANIPIATVTTPPRKPSSSRTLSWSSVCVAPDRAPPRQRCSPCRPGSRAHAAFIPFALTGAKSHGFGPYGFALPWSAWLCSSCSEFKAWPSDPSPRLSRPDPVYRYRSAPRVQTGSVARLRWAAPPGAPARPFRARISHGTLLASAREERAARGVWRAEFCVPSCDQTRTGACLAPLPCRGLRRRPRPDRPSGPRPGCAPPAAVQTGVRFPGINKGLNGGREQPPGACIRCGSSTRHALRAVALRFLHDAAALAHLPDGLAAAGRNRRIVGAAPTTCRRLLIKKCSFARWDDEFART